MQKSAPFLLKIYMILIIDGTWQQFLRGAPFFGSACSSVSVLTLFCSQLHCLFGCFWLACVHFLCQQKTVFCLQHYLKWTISNIRDMFAFEHVFCFVWSSLYSIWFVLHKIRAFLQRSSAAKTSHPLCSYTTSRGLPLYRTTCVCMLTCEGNWSNGRGNVFSRTYESKNFRHSRAQASCMPK